MITHCCTARSSQADIWQQTNVDNCAFADGLAVLQQLNTGLKASCAHLNVLLWMRQSIVIALAGTLITQHLIGGGYTTYFTGSRV
jgi:hypothetical protein